jgi:hypothetical protein
MSDRKVRAKITSEREVEQLLRRAAKRSRPSRAFSAVPHGRETDANREFASHREAGSVVWFFGAALPAFVIVYVICVKIGAI